MPITDFLSRLGVCSWSLRPASAAQLVFQLQGLGLTKFQCALDPLRTDPRGWNRLANLCADQGLTIVSGMFTTLGEDYTTLESIRRTGGITPDATWPENWRNIQKAGDLARQLGVRLVSFHAGFLPHEPAHPDYDKLLQRLRQMADWFADHGLELAMETGQETAATLRSFLQALDRKNVGINFDPANIILYDQGDPIQALRELAPWVRQCHIKDALRAKVPGTWGEEVAVGSGQVNWPDFFRTLKSHGFGGYLCVEREAGQQRAEDIATARRHVTRIIEELSL